MPFPLLTLCVLAVTAGALAVARRTGQYAAVALVASTIVLVLHGVVYFHYTPDDSYISFRYAHNLAEGRGLVWNPGEHVEGYTNFLWVMLLAGFDLVGLDLVTSSRWAGIAFAVAAAALAFQLTTQLLPGANGRLAGLIAAILLTSSGTWA
jgi:hypothetical protein